MVDVLEIRPRVMSEIRGIADPVIPVVLPPKVALNPHPKPTDQHMGSIELTIREGDGRLGTYSGWVKSFDEGGAVFSVGNRRGYYAHFEQKDGRLEAWFDISQDVEQGRKKLEDDHPVFGPMIRQVPNFTLVSGGREEPQYYAELGPVDLWGFLRNRSTVDRAA